jgi:Domain of unknown function (DUF6487)
MEAGKNRCPECRGEMVVGFLPEYTRNRVMRSLWIEGVLKTSFWTGVDIKGKDVRAVVTWRCSDCGLLRSYAERAAAPPGIFGTGG